VRRSIRFQIAFFLTGLAAACGGTTTLDRSVGDDDDVVLLPTGGTGPDGVSLTPTGGGPSPGTGGTFDDPFLLDEAVHAYCDAATTQCDYPQQGCFDDLSLLVDASAVEGCPDQLESVLWCGFEAGVECGLGLPHPPVDPCYPLVLDLSYCLGDSSAFPELCDLRTSGSMGYAECGADCIAYGVACRGDPAGLMQCECTHGPLAGRAFEGAAACTDGIALATQACWLEGI
jgi:hypothetical protein